ncbi:MAG: hypothetical protein K2H96_05555 [Muribaculaceae bacterium]|nr:hypothetical protein [Muribaculaceae bacterium]
MKIVYTLAAIAMFAGITSAATSKVPAMRSLQEPVSSEMNVNLNLPKKAPAKISTKADDWKKIGTGTFRDFFFSHFYRVDPYDIEMEMEQSISDPSKYRILNMYQNGIPEVLEQQGAYSFDATDEAYVYINTFQAVDPETNETVTKWYIPEACSTGMYVESMTGLPQGTMSVMWYAVNLVSQYGEEKVNEVYPEMFGTLEDGVFNVRRSWSLTYEDEETGEMVTEENPILMIRMASQEQGYGYVVNKKGTFAMSLPGVTLPAPPDPFETYTFIGECQMENNFLTNFFGEKTNPVGTVEVYEEPGMKGSFHIKNAYIAGDWVNEEISKEIDLAINLSEPLLGIMEEQSTGFIDEDATTNFGEVEVMSASAAYMYYVDKQYQVTASEFLSDPRFEGMNIYIDATTKRIMLPKMAIKYFLPELPETSEYYLQMISINPDSGSDSWIQLPADYVLPVSAVNNISADDVNAPVKYFNLQGMEVANPEAGQVVIKKQGSKATKFIVK